MSRTTLPLSQERIAPFDLEAFVQEAATLNQRALESCTLLCPKVPSDLEAKVGDHLDHQEPHQNERVFGSLPHKTTNIEAALGWE